MGLVKKTEGHGRINKAVNTYNTDYRKFGLKYPVMKQMQVHAVADMGCLVAVIELNMLYRLSLRNWDLVTFKVTTISINGKPSRF